MALTDLLFLIASVGVAAIAGGVLALVRKASGWDRLSPVYGVAASRTARSLGRGAAMGDVSFSQSGRSAGRGRSVLRAALYHDGLYVQAFRWALLVPWDHIAPGESKHTFLLGEGRVPLSVPPGVGDRIGAALRGDGRGAASTCADCAAPLLLFEPSCGACGAALSDAPAPHPSMTGPRLQLRHDWRSYVHFAVLLAVVALFVAAMNVLSR